MTGTIVGLPRISTYLPTNDTTMQSSDITNDRDDSSGSGVPQIRTYLPERAVEDAKFTDRQ